jgi:hypothetical protein
MKMDPALVERTSRQFDAEVLSEDHPAVPQLSELFGEHTFFLDISGLSTLEPAEPTETGAPAGKVVKLASWHDADQTRVTTHDPEPTDVVIPLGSGEPDKTA